MVNQGDAIPPSLASTTAEVERLSAELEQLGAELADSPNPRDAYQVTSKIAGVSRRLAETLGRWYADMRANMPRGPRRTAVLETLIGKVPHAALPSVEIDAALRSDDEGDRVVALSQLERSGDARHFDLALEAVAHSLSAFEQYHALVAMHAMLPHLTAPQRNRLREVLRVQRDYDERRKQWIKPNSDRWHLSERLLDAL